MFFAIDIDGVLAKDTNAYAQYLNRYFSLGIAETAIAEVQSYLEFAELPQVQAYIAQSEEACAEFNAVAKEAQYAADVQRLKVPIEGSREALHSIKDRYDFRYVTCRKSSTADTTQQWLAHYGYPFPEHVHYCEKGLYEKYLVAHQFAEPGESIVFVDDLALKLMTAFAAVLKHHYTMAKDLRSRTGILAFGHEQAPAWPFPVVPFEVIPLPSWRHLNSLLGIDAFV